MLDAWSTESYLGTTGVAGSQLCTPDAAPSAGEVHFRRGFCVGLLSVRRPKCFASTHSRGVADTDEGDNVVALGGNLPCCCRGHLAAQIPEILLMSAAWCGILPLAHLGDIAQSSQHIVSHRLGSVCFAGGAMRTRPRRFVSHRRGLFCARAKLLRETAHALLSRGPLSRYGADTSGTV